MSWTAVVPLKAGGSRKSRLSPRLSETQRARLSETMAGHVLACLARCVLVERILLLSPVPPSWAEVAWRPDEGRGLNLELTALREAEPAVDLLVVHADLPLLSESDISGLVAAAEASGWAIAPDRHGAGTNALAVKAGRPLDFAFGPDSFALHHAQAPQASVVHPTGLALDIDTPEDLDAALAQGFLLPA